jgi:hypothetical protein
MNGNYIRIEGLKIMLQDGSQGGITSSGHYNQIVKNHISTSSSSLGLNNTAMGISGNYNNVEGNYVEKTCFGYALNGTYNIFQKNEATLLKKNGNCGDVDYMRFFGTGHVIKNNSFHGINMNEIGNAHVDCFQTFDNGGPDYIIRDVIIENNFCADAAQGMMLEGKIYKQSRGLIVRNNVFTRCGAWCVCAVDIAEVRFLNNTCDTTGGLHGIWCRGENSVATCEFKNNLIYGTGTLYGVLETASLIDGNATSPGKGNLLFQPGRTITGFANDLKNQDPLFIDRNSNNYRIQSNSPAKNAGIAIIDWNSPTDKDGIARPQGSGWDIGAYEYRELAAPLNLRVNQY